MDLVRILHMVDMPSSGKHDFNHIYAVGLILSILIYFKSVLCDSVHIDFLSSHNVHPMSMLRYGSGFLFQECWLLFSCS